MAKVHTDAIQVVAEAFGVEVDDIMYGGKTRYLARARQACCYVLRKQFKLSYPEIGSALDVDHTTAMHAVKQTALRLETDDAVSEGVAEALRRIKAGRRVQALRQCSPAVTYAGSCTGKAGKRI